MTLDHKWPERLTLRDTKIHADEGQRIYTTATGYGYEKQEYVRSDLAAPSGQAPLEGVKALDRVGGVLSFVDGLFHVKPDGSGDIAFKDEDLEYGHGKDEEFRIARLDASEVIAIRDWLNRVTEAKP